MKTARVRRPFLGAATGSIMAGPQNDDGMRAQRVGDEQPDTGLVTIDQFASIKPPTVAKIPDFDDGAPGCQSFDLQCSWAHAFPYSPRSFPRRPARSSAFERFLNTRLAEIVSLDGNVREQVDTVTHRFFLLPGCSGPESGCVETSSGRTSPQSYQPGCCVP